MRLNTTLSVITITLCFIGFSQKCKYSREENIDDISILETKSTIVAGLTGSNIKFKLGKRDNSYYLVLDYIRSVSKKSSLSSITMNFPQVESIDKGHKLTLILDTGEEVVLESKERKNIEKSDANPLFYEYKLSNLEYSILDSDMEKLTSNFIVKLKLEYFKSDQKSIFTHRSDLTKGKTKGLSKLLNCISIG